MLCTWRRKLTAAFVHEYAALAAPSTQIEMAAPSKRGGPLKTTTIDGAVLPVRREHSTQLTDVQLGGEGVETPDVETPSPPPSPPASAPRSSRRMHRSRACTRSTRRRRATRPRGMSLPR